MKKRHSRLSKMNLCVYEEGWCDGLGQEGGSLRKGWMNCLKYLKRGWNRKEKQKFQKLGQAGSRGGCLKKGR